MEYTGKLSDTELLVDKLQKSAVLAAKASQDKVDGLNNQLRPALVEAAKVPGLVEELEAMTKSRDDEVSAHQESVRVASELLEATKNEHANALAPLRQELSEVIDDRDRLKEGLAGGLVRRGWGGSVARRVASILSCELRVASCEL